MAEPVGEATVEKREDVDHGGEDTFRLWIGALRLAEKDEESWVKSAVEARERYRKEEQPGGVHFNILYSSIQTQVPAVYNSTPVPDVRRRFLDEDPVGKTAADAFERSLSHCMDEYDFDGAMNAVVHDSLLPGRGGAVVNYKPTMGEDGKIAYQTVELEHFQWDDFRRGPAKEWKDVPWVALRYRITRDEAIELNKKEGETVNLDYTEKGADKADGTNQVNDIFKRLTIWKIWDKAKREIVFIAPSYTDGPFAVEKDELKLKDFFPIPKPIYDIPDPSTLVPLVPFDMWKDQAGELDRITQRIHSLVNCLRWRGIRPSQIEELDKLKDAKDGELIPSESMDTLAMMQGANPDRAIWIMPIDKLIMVIRELVAQREAVKQVIFEISGLADIMRGETNPNETLGAQQIKAQWGSMRMQDRQREAQRFARDVMRIKAEIIGEHFEIPLLQMMTGIKLPTAQQKQMLQLKAQQIQAQGGKLPPEAQEMMNQPTWDEVKAVMASDALRSFRVDVESDSTIKADLTRAQQNMSGFVEGLASFGNAVGPAVQAGVIPLDIVADLLTGFARNFKLGRQAEDALERLGQIANQPKPEQPDPAQIEAQAKQKEAEQKMQEAQEKAKMDHAENMRKLEIDREVKLAEVANKKMVNEEELKMKKADFDFNYGSKLREAQVEVEAEETASVKPAIEGIIAELDRVAQTTAAVVAEVQAQRAEADAPVEVEMIKENGKVVGGIKRQGDKVTEIRLN